MGTVVEDKRELATGYYLDNFNYLLNFVTQNYDHLLSDDEKTFVSVFHQLDEDAKRLYVRLLGRKGPLFRQDKLHYTDISDINAAANGLQGSGLLVFSPLVESEHYLSLLVKSELARLFSLEVKQHRRGVLDELVLARWEAEEILARLPFPVMALQGQAFVLVHRLLFFGNLHQDLTDFVLRDLGVTPFEPYEFDAKYSGFQSRSQLDITLHAYDLSDQAYVALANEDAEELVEFSCTKLLDLPRHEPSVQKRYSRVLNRVARQLERYQEYDLALQLYQASNRVPARERIARIYLSPTYLSSNIESQSAERSAGQSFNVCEQIIADPWDESELDFALAFGRRITKKYELSRPSSARTWSDALAVPTIETQEIELPEQENLSVELMVVDWYQSQGISAHYVENTLFTGLFGLLFWDIIFTPVEGAFFNPFQRGPMDLFTAEFYLNRSGLIDDRLALLAEGNLHSDLILKTHKAKQGISNYFVNWRWLERPLLEMALDRIPTPHLVSLFERMLLDLRANTSGFPDLILFPQSGGYCLVEVKGPGDKLQKNQHRWFNTFNQKEIPNQLLKVQFSV